jgi:putative ABC transport system permease protein
MLDLRENISVAMDTLRSHKVRSALTVLGIVIGVTSVISVAAIITGLNGFIQAKVASFGPNTYFLTRIPIGPQNFGKQSEKVRARRYFEVDYGQRLRDAAPGSLESVTILGTRASFFGGQGNQIRYEGNLVDKIILRGAEPEYISVIPMFAVERGRFVSRYDEDHARPVIVLGADIADSLFPSLDPLGKTVRLNGTSFDVIGVFAREPGLFGGPGVDQFAIIPFSTFHKYYPDSKELMMAFVLKKSANPASALDEVTDAFRRIRRVPPRAENDFEIMASDFMSTLWNQLTGALVILTGIISSVGLLVGGIGVMNIMLISVTERTGEIGVRKAIGASKTDIRVQFLMEATMLTLLGGAIGIMLGGLIALAVRTFVPSIPATLSLLWVTLGVAMSVGVGLFFGYYPANRAANLDPIVCLRYE